MLLGLIFENSISDQIKPTLLSKNGKFANKSTFV
jgi:hypothetical protein